jgi:hypothetical protein
MFSQQDESWVRRLFRRMRPTTTTTTSTQLECVSPERVRPVDVAIVPALVEQPPAAVARVTEDWRELVHQGRRVIVSWDSYDGSGPRQVEGEVRLTFEETVWIWLDEDLSERGRPMVGQAIHVLTAREDAMRMVPCRLLEDTQGASLQVAVSGRVSRVQRRDDVRVRVELPPISAVRLSLSGRPTGLLGLQALDLSAGGIRVRSGEPLRAGETLRLVLRIDDGEPLTPTLSVLVGGSTAQGRFESISEAERRRIVQYVYRQEIAERRRAKAAAAVE